MTDLFTWEPKYPHTAGWKADGTSRRAAEEIAPRAGTLKAEVLALLKVEALTADECADRLGKSILSVRPRVAELHAANLVIDTGRTRENASGVQASIWRAK